MSNLTIILIISVLFAGMMTYMSFQDQIHNLFTKGKN